MKSIAWFLGVVARVALVTVIAWVMRGCAPSGVQHEDGPACLYEVMPVTNDAGATSNRFVTQEFATFAECRAYSRLCNGSPWPLEQSARCTECCNVCGL